MVIGVMVVGGNGLRRRASFALLSARVLPGLSAMLYVHVQLVHVLSASLAVFNTE